ncbi:MAG: hypothetical protein L3J26_12825 [Candidatus Polarisedimenticolaceae bacterium]|nr:hypothetical protein [Candidatus Polarisedimenticolaceae bacterium]
MNLKTKGRADCHQATSITAFIKHYFTCFANHLKPIVLTLAAWGWFPIGLAEWFTHQGEQNNG